MWGSALQLVPRPGRDSASKLVIVTWGALTQLNSARTGLHADQTERCLSSPLQALPQLPQHQEHHHQHHSSWKGQQPLPLSALQQRPGPAQSRHALHNTPAHLQPVIVTRHGKLLITAPDALVARRTARRAQSRARPSRDAAGTPTSSHAAQAPRSSSHTRKKGSAITHATLRPFSTSLTTFAASAVSRTGATQSATGVPSAGGSQPVHRVKPASTEQVVRPNQLYPFTLIRYQLNADASEGESGEYLTWAIEVVKQLRAAGHSAYFAGGWVRDLLLGRPSKDIDLATSANVYQEVPLIFPAYTVKQLARSTARLERGGLTLEVTQLRGTRKEADLESLALDACLRDFTINGLYYDPETHEVLDFVYGVDHLRSKRLELPPHPMRPPPSFSPVLKEDPIRVLRAMRFASSLGLSISPELRREAMKYVRTCCFETGTGTAGVGNRRLFRELSKVCDLGRKSHTALSQAFKHMADLRLTKSLFPDLVVPDPDTCFKLQEGLTQAAMTATPSDRSIDGVWFSPELRVLVLVDATQGSDARQCVEAINSHMRHMLKDAWSSGLYESAATLLQLFEELYRPYTPQEAQEIKPTKGGLPDLLPLLKNRIAREGRDEDWKEVFTGRHYPMLEAWVLLWLPDAERQAVSGHLKALKEHLGVPAASLQPAQLQGSLK